MWWYSAPKNIVGVAKCGMFLEEVSLVSFIGKPCWTNWLVHHNRINLNYFHFRLWNLKSNYFVLLDIKVASIFECKSSIMHSSYAFAKWKGIVTHKPKINIFLTVWSMMTFLSHWGPRHTLLCLLCAKQAQICLTFGHLTNKSFGISPRWISR